MSNLHTQLSTLLLFFFLSLINFTTLVQDSLCAHESPYNYAPSIFQTSPQCCCWNWNSFRISLKDNGIISSFQGWQSTLCLFLHLCNVMSLNLNIIVSSVIIFIYHLHISLHNLWLKKKRRQNAENGTRSCQKGKKRRDTVSTCAALNQTWMDV